MALRAINLTCATDERSLMQELMRGLSVPLEATQSWDHLLAALTQPEQAERYGVLLQGYRDFCYRQRRLCDQMDAVLTEAQRILAAQNKQMYLLAAYAEADPKHF
ncbi:barstar family protein [Deinococcus radiophilus]|uniref:barstar family protein n=1 Tax=Deinococcus radiophilus TaxID=32062 RepID=UPI00360DD773